uniref:Uncharacterized protein n=1 Tax=Nelumbo nucifera TaxID=4432 RepID=A0A822XED8_NELNU|nr:TPA_asm: hypothetical protein HUJ06_020153 [Nelumbo nucifera]
MFLVDVSYLFVLQIGPTTEEDEEEESKKKKKKNRESKKKRRKICHRRRSSIAADGQSSSTAVQQLQLNNPTRPRTAKRPTNKISSRGQRSHLFPPDRRFPAWKAGIEVNSSHRRRIFPSKCKERAVELMMPLLFRLPMMMTTMVDEEDY